MPGPVTPLLWVCSRDKCSWVPPNSSSDGMAWDGMMFPSLLCKCNPHWQPFDSASFSSMPAFLFQVRIYFETQQISFASGSNWFCLGYYPYPGWMLLITWEVLLMFLGRRQSWCLLLAPPSPCRTLDTPFYDDDVSVENYHLSWTAKE